MTSINTNISALIANKNLNTQSAKLDEAMTRLSSGLRINSAADDAAGSSIASKMESQIGSLGVAIRNAHDGISMTQTAEGALGEIENILQRVRELAVQAGNSTLSAADRSSIQDEVTALVSEIDSIASTSNFNGLNLLNGKNSSVNFQTGIHASDALEVKLENSSSSALGLSGSTGVSKLTSERITLADNSAVAVGDVKINGNNFLSATIADFSSSTEGAGAVADAINLQTGIHGAVASAFNEVKSTLQGSFAMSGTFTINGETIALSTSKADLVNNINLLVDGVEATLNADDTFTLHNNDGGQILIAVAAAASVGLTAGTYEGYVVLENADGSAVSIEAGSKANGYGSDAAGTTADVQAFGFNETSKDGKSIESAIVTTNKLLLTDQVEINDVMIGASLTDSAASKATAINALTSEHGVTATAETTLFLDINFDKDGTETSFLVQGVAITILDDNSVSDVATLINTLVTDGSVYATAESTGLLKLSNAQGNNIIVNSLVTGYVAAATDINNNAVAAASLVYTAFGALSLSTSNGGVIKLEDNTAANSGLAKLGLQGGSETFAVTNSGVDVNTEANSLAALTNIDSAINKVSSFRSSFGAVENRLDARINNMTTLQVNTQAAQSRIEDADFASETTNLTKAQILSQAATSMLAQANSSKQNLLALLQG
jgi:flagellin